ncbi:MAG: 50S ribosomal protein L25 [Actinomycetota bacterium]|nr:50S ribosomal protein L25 [Actinomycetota bacterium]
MPEVTLEAQTGRVTGSRSTRRLRSDGLLPGVVYGHGIEPTPLSVNSKQLRLALSTEAGMNAILRLELGGERHLAMVKNVQRHPVRGDLSHVDFLVIGRHETLAVDVPVVLTGEAEQVNQARGLLAQELFTLSVHAPADSIPNSIEADVSGMAVGDSLRVGDLALPDGVSTSVAPDTAVVVAQSAQALTSATEVTEADAEGGGGAEAQQAATGA